ncbi:TrmB family transcriptional regulator [Methanorbis rubei]|uniref:Transcription regulator TrmB N-terminal domain-containing protein n=1 Tax=Methanorbis rubei TaxID=3028300 RepID=A0AAE4SC19_9EURY|nr:hypothetical protein [Methanocorpusculaceae archaeon Cs1]
MNEELVSRLKKFGMNEYEAKVYSSLFELRVASAREVHDLTSIPRGRVYETLDRLMEKRFVGCSGASPVRYHVNDVAKTFEHIKTDTMSALNELSEYLTDLERDRPARLTQAYELQNVHAIDSQIRLMFQRAKSEMIIFCDDAEFLKRYAFDLADLQKRLDLYVVLRNRKLAESTSIKCYLGGREIENGFFSPHVPDDRSIKLRLAIYADRRDFLQIVEDSGDVLGIFLSNDPFSGYLYHCILDEIKPI